MTTPASAMSIRHKIVVHAPITLVSPVRSASASPRTPTTYQLRAADGRTITAANVAAVTTPAAA